ncbi:MAG: bifunctional adenosylcobinamide kinase/adenosylcobinamide-phosphate guanylyltransferase [Chloroflexi bacterium RBG_16_50_9]|nr:MAG: bifunctional adenosylcobinamide kinase/adenosylcobinamide-phosphate guanylyltransferase [Chloroflexi bacterium RBG_16_50_9]
MKSTLITGGARSGKSRFAQELALKRGGAVLFVATAEAGDEEMKRRIAEHRKARPPAWETLEATTHLGRQITWHIGQAQTVIIDCITLLVNNIFEQCGVSEDKGINATLTEKKVMAEIKELLDCMERAAASFIIVTSEVGLGLVPASTAGRLYRDCLGRANQVLAQHADEVIMMVAGIPVTIKAAR